MPVAIPVVPGQCWSCSACGQCCRVLVAHLFAEDRARLDSQGWKERLDVRPYVRAGRGHVINKHPDGSCVFLDDDGRCRIHAEFGEEGKPFACRVFPFSVRPIPLGWQASLRFDCPNSASSEGRPIGQYHAWLSELVTHIEHRPPVRDESDNLQRGLRAAPEETDAVLNRYTRWLKRQDIPLMNRLIGAARVTTTLQQATLKNVRGPRFTELLNLLFQSLRAALCETPEPPTDRQRGMLRQLAFAHSEHLTLAELRSWFGARFAKRFRQVRKAGSFLRGTGTVPPLPGYQAAVQFAEIEATVTSADALIPTRDLVNRYLTARIAGRSVFGEGFYGWPVFSGLTALWLAIAASGWLTRYIAVAAGRSSTSFEDFAAALGIVDRAATRLPSLGTTAERMRVRYLGDNDGIARLINEYAPLGIEI